MDITRAAIEKNRITIVALIVIVASGLSAYSSMPRAEDPGFIIRTAMVVTQFPGASPERVEMLITDQLEKTIQEIPELDFITSQSKTGVSIIAVNIQERYRDMRPIWDSLRRKIDRARPELPAGVIGPTVNDEFGDLFGIIITVTGDGFSYAEVKDVADQVRDLLLRIDLVAKVDIYGAQEERVFVEYNNARLAEIGLSPLQLRNILENRNIIIPGGNVRTGTERISLEPSGNFESVEDIGRTVITLPGRSDLLFLEDLATVYRGYVDPPSTKLTSSGEAGLGLAISMREGGNLIELGAEIRELLNRIGTGYPIGIDFDIVAFQPDVVDRKVQNFVGNVYQAVGIVVLVMLLMLGVRTGLIVATLIPAAMIMSLMVMSLLDIWLDQMSLAALIISLGLLVDNAIVMAESIMVQMAAGKDRLEAAVDSARELRIPLLTSSLTTAAAFLPTYLAQSTTGEYVAPIFKVVTITLLASWILTLTMIPMLCVMFLKVKAAPEGGRFNSRFYRTYRVTLLMLVRHPYLSMAGVVLILFLALSGLGRVPNVFFPLSDTPMFTAELELPLGRAIERSEEVVQEIDAFIRSELMVNEDRTEGVTTWSSYIGRGAPRFVLSYAPVQPSPEYSFMIFNTTSAAVIPTTIEQIEAFCMGRFPDLLTTIQPLQLGPPLENPVEIRLSGESTDVLFPIVEQVKAELASIPGSKDIGDDWGQRTKKLVVKINEPRAQRAGVTNQDVAISLQTILSGFDTTDYREENEIIPVTLRSVAADRQDVGKLDSLNVYSQVTGSSVPLKQVADVSVAWEPARILRRDRLKTVTVHAGLLPGVTAQSITDQIEPRLTEQEQDWPIGYFYEFGGELETSGKAGQSVVAQMPVGGLIILLLLIGQFNSVRRTLIILLTIPLGLVGVTVGLIVADSYLGFMTSLGIISLAGIVINNGIVLIDRIKIEMEQNGLESRRAVIEAGPRRLRPILLATTTTVGGLIPLWLGGGPMYEPMAIAIIFGLLFATMLTLGVVPVLYTILFRLRFKGFQY